MSNKLAMELFTTSNEVKKIKVDKYTFDHVEDYKNFGKVK